MMQTRDKVQPCATKRLDEIDGLIAASVKGALPPGPIWIGHPFFSPLSDSQFKSVIQSDAAGLLSNAEQASYAAIYNLFAMYSQAELVEEDAWGDLRTLEKHPAGSAVLDWQLRSAMQKARTARFEMEVAERQAKLAAAPFGIAPVESLAFTLHSVCIPLNTTREEGEKLVVKGRRNRSRYNEP
jgi:hypothetical protein